MPERATRTSRASIIEAALACTVENGWEATSLQAVRERARVSNGTLFHHFPTRQHLKDAVVAAGLADHQEVLLEQLRTAESARAGVMNLVLRHLQWLHDNRKLARLLLFTPPQELMAELDDAAMSASRRFVADIAEWLRSNGWRGNPELPVVNALWIGPAQDYARGWLATRDQDLEVVAPILAEAAWNAVRPLLRRPRGARAK
jgi:AcrR family transcriptional regulator